MGKVGAASNGAGFVSKPYLRNPTSSLLAPGANASLNLDLECWYCKVTGHFKYNCITLNHELAMEQKNIVPNISMPKIKNSKLETPLSKDQGRGAANSGPMNMAELGNVLRSISSQGILAQDKIDIMQHAVAKCPKKSAFLVKGSKYHHGWTLAMRFH